MPAERSLELTSVNEFLTQMEAYRGILVCCTNLVSSLDAASLRRFQVKVEFRALKGEGVLRLLGGLFPAIVVPEDAAVDLEPLAGLLTPGELSAIADRLEFSGMSPDWAALLGELHRECALKRKQRKIGFGGNGD